MSKNSQNQNQKTKQPKEKSLEEKYTHGLITQAEFFEKLLTAEDQELIDQGLSSASWLTRQMLMKAYAASYTSQQPTAILAQSIDINNARVPSLKLSYGLAVIYGHKAAGKSYFVRNTLPVDRDTLYYDIAEPIAHSLSQPLSVSELDAILFMIKRRFDQYITLKPLAPRPIVVLDSLTWALTATLSDFPVGGALPYGLSPALSYILGRINDWAAEHSLLVFAVVNPDDALKDSTGYNWCMDKIITNVQSLVHLVATTDSAGNTTRYRAILTARAPKWDEKLQRWTDGGREWQTIVDTNPDADGVALESSSVQGSWF